MFLSRLTECCAKMTFVVLSKVHLEKHISNYFGVYSKKGNEQMPKIRRSVIINGERHWINANTEQEYADKLAAFYTSTNSDRSTNHNFADYALSWYEIYSKPNIEKATAVTYKRQIDLYLIPAFGEKDIEGITIDDIQKMFNDAEKAKSTKQKIKTVLNMIFEAAIDDKIIQRNPLKSKRLKISGSDSNNTKEYTVNQMQYLVRHIPDVSKQEDRMYLALQALHPMRLEEVLGLKWKDIDKNSMTINICRAVTHPTRSRPEIKSTKTESSSRVIGLSNIAVKYLSFGKRDDFVFGGAVPYTYSKLRKMCERIQNDTGFEERVVPRRFRTTVLTDIYNETKDVKTVQSAAGHTTPQMTLKYYVKGREGYKKSVDAIDSAYG